MRRRRSLWLPWLASLASLAGAPASAIDLPRENECPAIAGPSGGTPLRLHQGMVLSRADLPRLSSVVPAEVWRHRGVFFHDGMRIAIGACHRRYAPPRHFTAATDRFWHNAEVDDDGNLSGHIAGLPFPIDQIDSAANDAAVRWAWNFELRHRGAGPSGRFRIVEVRDGASAHSSSGRWFQIVPTHRTDLPQSEYRATEVEPAAWIAGGRFAEPSGARGIAWKQTRPLAAAQKFTLPDDVFVFVPSLDKVRRAATPWVDGLYLPRHREPGGAIRSAGTVASAGAATDHMPRGFTGLSIRPNAYVWRVLGVREVIAPLNAARSGYPADPQRSFGPSGLSLADDRWDVRQAIVIQGALRDRGRGSDWLTLYVDTQTQQPLYAITERRGSRRLAEVCILAHRWSGDLPGYAAWPGGDPAALFDPAAAVCFDERDETGSRRESYDARSLPLAPDEMRRLTSLGNLERGD
jgi:Protein of unknown function (DUF1329)